MTFLAPARRLRPFHCTIRPRGDAEAMQHRTICRWLANGRPPGSQPPPPPRGRSGTADNDHLASAPVGAQARWAGQEPGSSASYQLNAAHHPRGAHMPTRRCVRPFLAPLHCNPMIGKYARTLPSHSNDSLPPPMSTRSERSISVAHPWPRRILRTMRFGFARTRNPGTHVEARAALFDLKFRGPSADCITRHIYRLGAHEPDISRYIVERIHLGPRDIAIEVGANIGWYTALLSRLSDPTARIF